jgi:hypothetical protein
VTLADLRKLSIRRQYRIHFVLANGMECVVTEHGIARLPAMKGVPDFNLEKEFASVSEFLLEPAAASKKGAPQSRPVSRDELAAMTGASGAAAPGRDDHEDE